MIPYQCGDGDYCSPEMYDAVTDALDWLFERRNDLPEVSYDVHTYLLTEGDAYVGLRVHLSVPVAGDVTVRMPLLRFRFDQVRTDRVTMELLRRRMERATGRKWPDVDGSPGRFVEDAPLETLSDFVERGVLRMGTPWINGWSVEVPARYVHGDGGESPVTFVMSFYDYDTEYYFDHNPEERRDDIRLLPAVIDYVALRRDTRFLRERGGRRDLVADEFMSRRRRGPNVELDDETIRNRNRRLFAIRRKREW